MINFDEATHTYTNEEGKTLISGTTLLKKHGLSPDYSNVAPSVLNAKAERGTLIHKEIEDFIKHGELGFTTELYAFKEFIESKGYKIIHSELIVNNDIAAGTIDLILEKDGVYYIADIKTTSVLHKEAVSWQLSVYGSMYNELHKNALIDLKTGFAFHFDKEGKLNVVDIPLKPFEEVEKLFQCEREGIIYKQENKETTSLLNEIALLDQQAAKDLEEKTNLEIKALEPIKATIEEIEKRRNEAVTRANELRGQLLYAMQCNNIKTIENDTLKVTYVAPSTRTTLDTDQLRKDLKDDIKKYEKVSNVKASLRITQKKEK